MVLSYGLWKSRYGGDPSLVGKTHPHRRRGLHGDRRDAARFRVAILERPRQLWVPVGYTKTDFGRGDNSFLSIARLKPGVSLAQARAEMEAVGSSVAGSTPRKTRIWAPRYLAAEFGMEGTSHHDVDTAGGRGVRAADRLRQRGEPAAGARRGPAEGVRHPARAGRAGSRIARQLLTESILLALAGGVAGLLLAAWGTRVLFFAFRLDSLYLPLAPSILSRSMAACLLSRWWSPA